MAKSKRQRRGPNEFDQLIKKLIDVRKQKDPTFSIRKMAAEIGVSHVFLVNALNGKGQLPVEYFDRIVRVLQVDSFTERRLVHSFLRVNLKDLTSKSASIKKFSKATRSDFSAFGEPEPSIPPSDSDLAVDQILAEKLSLFSPWYIPVLLDLVATENFSDEPSWMARRLGITKYEAEYAWRFLKDKKLVQLNPQGCWQKTNRNLHQPTNTKLATRQVRDFYRKMLASAINLMVGQKADEGFEDRLIFGITCSANMTNWPQIKGQLEDGIHQTARKFAEGNCEEVYCIMVSAIPLSKT